MLILIITLPATLCIAVLVCRAQLQCACRSSYTPKVRHMASWASFPGCRNTYLGTQVQQPLCIIYWLLYSHSVGGSKVPHACLCYICFCSLRNIFKELSNDIEGFKAPDHGCLIGWAKQGKTWLSSLLDRPLLATPTSGHTHFWPHPHIRLWLVLG